MMKRFVHFVVALAALILFTGCSRQSEAPKVQDQRLKILCTTAMIQDVVSKIGGDRFSYSTLIVGEIDPHSYELVKGDDEKIQEADLLFYNGLNLEHGASLRHKISCHPTHIGLGDYILKTYPGEILYEQGQVDPHVWMDVSLWGRTVAPIVAALCQKDPEGKEFYEQRAKKIYEEMIEFHEQLKMQFAQIPESKRYLVTSHDAFAYFTRAYLSTPEERRIGTWRKRFAAPEGIAPEGQLGTGDLRKIVEYLVEYQVRVVFPESNVSQDSLRKIVLACREKNVTVEFSQKALYGDSMPPADSMSGSYLGMLGANAVVLIEAWKQ